MWEEEPGKKQVQSRASDRLAGRVSTRGEMRPCGVLMGVLLWGLSAPGIKKLEARVPLSLYYPALLCLPLWWAVGESPCGSCCCP